MRIVLSAIAVAMLPGLAAAQSFEGFSVGGQATYTDAETSGAAALSGEDTLIGLRAYYDADLGGYLVGGGLQYDSGEVDLDGAAQIDDVTRLAVRAGTAATGVYLYGTAGFVQASTSGAANAGSTDGYFFGAGFETFVADQITVGAEVLQHDFNGFENIDTLDAEVTTIGLNVNYRF